jgi:hypothetical protein
MSQLRQSANYNISQAQLARAHSAQAVMAKARAARIERRLSTAEIARIHELTALRVSRQRICRSMGISEYAVQQVFAGKTPNIYRAASDFDPIRFAREHNETTARIRALMEAPR